MSELTFRDFQRSLRDLGLTADSRLLVQASLDAFGPVRGGAETLAGALAASAGLVVMPAFTPQCQVVPFVGPAGNGLTYGDRLAENAEAELFHPDLPATPDLGPAVEILRRRPEARRSTHPLLSFAAVGAEAALALAAQTLAEPLGPVAWLAQAGGDLLLMGVDHTRNLALPLAERRAGRRSFTRWALTAEGVRACPGWPGCADGFNAIRPHLPRATRQVQLGRALLQRVPLAELLAAAEALLRRDALALLCARPDCALCQTVRAGAPVPAG